MNDSDDATPPAAAILVDGQADIDGLLADAAQAQRQAGRRVRGLLMTYPDKAAGCAGAMLLIDLHTGDEYLVSQPLGTGSSACRADTQGFARASGVLRAALQEQADLVICNRFGGLEAEGGGFRAELLDLMVGGIPVLTAVKPAHVSAWRSFSGGAQVLPATADAVARWLGDTLPPGTLPVRR